MEKLISCERENAKISLKKETNKTKQNSLVLASNRRVCKAGHFSTLVRYGLLVSNRETKHRMSEELSSCNA
jgi:hypothetical protein